MLTTATGSPSASGIPFTVRAGRIFFVTPAGSGSGTTVASPMSPLAAYSAILPGDTFYLRTGSYTGIIGGNWGARNFAFGSAQAGTAGNPVAFVGYPSETATLVTMDNNSGGNIVLRNNGGDTDLAHYMTFANLTFVGGAGCISGGGFWQNDGSGASNAHFVGNVFSALYCTGCNTMTGLVSVEGDHWRVLGNEFKNTGGAPSINNNHIVYVNTGADDAEIGWNYIHDVHVGHVIQVHTDTAPSGKHLFANIRIHDNVITAANPSDSRGINVGNMQPTSYGAIYNNVLYNIGQDFSGIAAYNGIWKIYNNTLYNVNATAASHSGMIMISNQANGGPIVEIVNNIFYADGPATGYVTISDSPLWGSPSQVAVWSNNLYFNSGAAPGLDIAPVTGNPNFINPAAGNFRLQAGSPAINSGSSVVTTVTTIDHDGVGRPQGSTVDIGAYEFH
jgi:hypothetical protein